MPISEFENKPATYDYLSKHYTIKYGKLYKKVKLKNGDTKLRHVAAKFSTVNKIRRDVGNIAWTLHHHYYPKVGWYDPGDGYIFHSSYWTEDVIFFDGDHRNVLRENLYLQRKI